MIPSRTLLVLAAVVALANLAACSRSDGGARPAQPTAVPFSLEAPPAPAPTPAPTPVPDAAVIAATPTAPEAEAQPTPAEVAAIEHPRVAK